jgi:hypothetical protein
MKKILLFCIVSIPAISCLAQKKVFDLVEYTVPKGADGKKWKEETKGNITGYTTTNKKNGSWCQISIVKSTVSKGSIDADFESEWEELVVKNYTPAAAPQLSEIEEADGWKVKAGTAKFTFNNNDAIVLLTTASGFNRCVSIVATTNNQDYLSDVQNFLESVQLQKVNSPSGNSSNQPVQTNATAAKPDGFHFNTSNFDDGWTSTVQEDWVEVTKGNIKVLLHYPKDGTVFAADPEPLTNAAWDILVAPRYSNLRNYRTAYISTYNRPYLGMGYAKENSTGKEVFIVLFRRGGVWIEFVTPDKNTFIQEYKVDPETVQWDTDSDLLNPLVNMSGYNRFAVAASDFKGKWTSDFTGIQQMYNVYTGNYAGMNMHQSSIVFDFKAGNTYYWKLMAVNGMVGNMKYDQVESNGTFSVPNNWQLKCSKIEKGPKLYHAFWSCIKGARILNLLDADAPGSGMYTQYGLAK